MTKMNTKRKVAIFTDIHGLLEPLEAVLEDIKKRKIEEIYSLGDNIGIGPNPKEVIHLLEENKVISIKGNSEEYTMLGTEPFYYFDEAKKKSQQWTFSKLGEEERKIIESYPHSIELNLGGKKIGLCHFASDVRFDFVNNSVHKYQYYLKKKEKAYQQFLATNSKKQREEIQKIVNRDGANNPKMKGYVSALREPLFEGKTVDSFDAIFQGHMHFKAYEHGYPTDFYTLRAMAMAYQENPLDKAYYVILTEKEDGFEIEEVLVPYHRTKMEKKILDSDIPDDTVKKYTGMIKKKDTVFLSQNR